MDKPNDVMIAPNTLMMLEKVGPSYLEDDLVKQDYRHTEPGFNTTPKADPTGRGRISPTRSMGEAESRLTSMLGSGLIKPEQLMQALIPRGAATDIDSNIFNRGLFSANKALTSEGLSDAEYFNRKQLLGGYAPSTPPTGNVDEIASTALAKKQRRKLTHLERKIEAYMAGGMTREEAERKITYDKAELKRLQAEPSKEDRAYDLALFNRRYASPLLHAQAFEEHIESILENKPRGWEQRVVALRKQQATILEAVNPAPMVSAIEPPPPPVMDFSTADLEQPERFIIKDLEGFKFDPDTHFDGLRLPYESCLFVLGEEPLRAVVLATQEDEDVLSLKLLSEQKAELPWHSIATLYVRLNGSKARLKWANTKRALDKRLGMVSSVLAFLAGEQIGDVEVTTVITAPEGREIPPPKPGFCYNVVSIVHEKRKARRRDWQGGTHASPREHKRKGHWWPSPKGGYLWRGPVIVNKGVLGRVDKEYHVTKLEGCNENTGE